MNSHSSYAPDSPVELRSRYGVLLLLLFSMICNVVVFFLPFMELRQGLIVQDYTLFRSVEMLWKSGIYVLAILVVAFSVVFPFAKLTVIASATLVSLPGPRLRQALALVERLGKWSMLDAFLVSIILVLTSNQLFVGASPRAGLPLFILAILLSMTAGEWRSRQLHHTNVATDAPSRVRKGTGWLILSGLALVAAIGLPFLKIRDWRLTDKSYSILTLIPELALEGAWIATCLVAVFLVLCPALTWVTSLLLWAGRIQPSSVDSNSWVGLAQRWSMLEVFALALAVFALESDSLMHTEVRWGAYFLLATLFLQMLFHRELVKKASKNH
jgi:paraquat-inducible protein A